MYRVLVVEDDISSRIIYSKLKTWNECGFYIAKEANNGAEALEILNKEKFDLVFTDIKMPVMNGIELLKALKKDYKNIICVLVSSFDDFEYARQGLVLGAFDYLLKPIDTSKLKDTLLRVKEHLETNDKKISSASVNKLVEELDLNMNDHLINRLVDFISNHLYEEVALKDLADNLGYSKDYLGKAINQKIGMTFKDLFLRAKIVESKELLRTGNYKAYEISELLGFGSVDNFSRVFKNVTGMTLMKFKAGEDK